MASETQAGILVDGRYRLVREIGRGGAAIVWRADDLHDGAPVAVKLLHPHLRLVEGPRRRFAREAEVLAELAHPSIVRAKGYNLEGSRPYIVMEYREGVRLDQELRMRTEDALHFDSTSASRILASLTDALSHAHEKGVIHRDLKPSNIILSPDGSACILDFGVARLLGESDQTTLGRMVGTYRYMSPEQARGASIDHRSDIYSLGLITYQIITLARPWGGDVPVQEILRKISGSDRPKPTAIRRELDPAFDEVIQRATAVDKRERPDSVAAFWTAMDPLLATLPKPVRPVAAGRSSTVPREETRSIQEDTHPLEPPAEDTHSIPLATRSAPRPRSRWGEIAAAGAGIASLAVIAAIARSPDAETSRVPPPVEARPAPRAEDPEVRAVASTVAEAAGIDADVDVDVPVPVSPPPPSKRRTVPRVTPPPPPVNSQAERAASRRRAKAGGPALPDRDPMDPLHELRRVIAAAEAAPRDGERFDRAADRVQEAIRASKVSGRAPRWMRMLELARLNRDHSGLAKIAEELEVSAR